MSPYQVQTRPYFCLCFRLPLTGVSQQHISDHCATEFPSLILHCKIHQQLYLAQVLCETRYANQHHASYFPCATGLAQVAAKVQAHAFAQGLDCNSADRSLQHGFTDALMLMASAKVSRIMDCPTTDATDTNATGATSLAESIPCAAHVKADSVTPDLVAHPRQGDSQEQGGDEVASVGVAGVDEVLPEVSRQDEEELEDGTVVCEQGGDGEELEDDTLVREGNPGGSMQGSQAVDGEACEAVRGGALDETLGDQMEDGGADEVAAGNGGADVETGGDAPPAAGGADAQE